MFESFAAMRVAINEIAVAGHNGCIGYLSPFAAEHLTELLSKVVKKSADKRFWGGTAEIGAARGGWKDLAASRYTFELNHQ